ncbi:hypothetical protein WLQ65_15285 [Pseudoalteromonas piscicida]|nr:hypothetical protein [Pseudoalteromonas piscicida]
MSKLAQCQHFRQELGQLLAQYKGYGFVLGFLSANRAYGELMWR